MFGLLLIGCSKRDVNNTLVGNVSTEAETGLNYHLEVTSGKLFSNNSYVKEEISDRKVSWGGSDYTVSYTETNGKFDSYYIDTFFNKEKKLSVHYLEGTDKIVGIDGQDEYGEKIAAFTTEQELIATVNKYAEQNVDVKKFKCRVETEIAVKHEDGGTTFDTLHEFYIPKNDEEVLYYVDYEYYQGDLKTYEALHYEIKDGMIVSYSYDMPGIFSVDNSDVKLPKDDVEKIVDSYLKEKLADRYSDIKYDISGMIVGKNSVGNYVVKCFVDFDTDEETHSLESHELDEYQILSVEIK